MRAPSSFAVAVRRRDGSILVREREMRSEKTALGKVPFARGIVSLVESLRLGSEALRFSADQLERDLLAVGSSRVDLQACKLEYSIVSPK